MKSTNCDTAQQLHIPLESFILRNQFLYLQSLVDSSVQNANVYSLLKKTTKFTAVSRSTSLHIKANSIKSMYFSFHGTDRKQSATIGQLASPEICTFCITDTSHSYIQKHKTNDLS